MAIYYPECRINLSAIMEGFGGPDDPVEIPDVIPHSVNVHLNSYKEADTWEVVFDAKRFPFSPELIRSAAVEIYLYLKPDLTSPTTWQTAENRVVTGLVDQATLTEDEDGGKVSFSGRDYTSLLIDSVWDPTNSGRGGRIPEGELVDVVQELVNEATQADRIGRTLRVIFTDRDNTGKIITSDVDNAVSRRRVTIPKTTKSKSRKTRGQSVKADSTYWDVIYKLCLSYGYIVYVKDFEVVITKPHVLQDAALAQYRVAYGRNLEMLEVERKLSKEAVPQIRVRSYDPVSRSVIEGRFPSDETDPKSIAKKGRTAIGVQKGEYKVFTVPDVKDADTLKEIARTVYFTIARGEGVIRFATPHLRDLTNQDLLKIRAGDSVEVVWDAFNAEVMADPKVSTQTKVSVLRSLGYSPEVSSLVATQYSKLDYFRRPLYVKEVNLTWDCTEGCAIDVEAMNFIVPQISGGSGG